MGPAEDTLMWWLSVGMAFGFPILMLFIGWWEVRKISREAEEWRTKKAERRAKKAELRRRLAAIRVKLRDHYARY